MDRIHVMQLVRSFEIGQLSRRSFLAKATVALGSAAAASSLLAACTPRSPETMPEVVEDEGDPEARESLGAEGPPPGESAMVRYGERDGRTLTGYLALPEGEGPAPAVVMLQEWWGLNEHIEEMADRLAAEGFVVLAPDLYDGVVVSEPDEARKLVMELDRAAAVADVGDAADYLLARDDVAAGGVGVMGFCMGGGLSLAAGADVDEVAAVIAYYGSPPDEAVAARIGAPVLGLYGGQDQGIPVEDVEAMMAILEDAGTTNELVVYDEAGHAFANDTRESHDPEAAADAWARTLDWLRTHLPDA